jgi:hypothetical protein
LSGWLPAALGRADTLAFTKPPSAASLENPYGGEASAAEAAARSTRPTAPRASDTARKAPAICRRSRQSDAVAENAKADEQQKQVQAEAAKDRVDADAKAVDKNVGALVDKAVIQAEGETKVALAKCEALEGDAQKECKDTANAHMDSVREKAKAAKAG